MTTTTIETTTVPLHDVGNFLGTYSARLLAYGSTCLRLQQNIDRMAARFGVKADVFVMPRHVHICVSRDGECHTAIVSVPSAPVSFSVNTSLSRLSWDVADGRLDMAQARARFERILERDRQPAWVTLLLVPVANASFCRLFGGDAVAMAVVALATLAGYFVKQQLLERRVDVRAVFIICAFVSGVLGATDGLFGLGSTPQVAIGTSVLYLVPGIPLLNSFSDLLDRRYICAFGRFADAAVLTACLSAGLCTAMLLMGVDMF